MSNVISIFSARKRKEPESAQPIKSNRPPTGPVVGSCVRCSKPIQESELVKFDPRKFHFHCFMDATKLKGWKSSLGWMFWRLAKPFAQALGKERVKPIIDPFCDEDLTFAETFKAFNELECMLHTTPVVDGDLKAEALKALGECKEQLRIYARLP